MTMTVNTPLTSRAHDGVVADHDPAARPRRRSFSPEYKLAILEAYDRLDEPEAKGALLRREGLYSSHIVEWRRARDAAAVEGLSPRVRQSKTTPEAAALAKANRRIERLEDELARHKLALDIAGKAHALLEMLAEGAAPEQKPKQ